MLFLCRHALETVISSSVLRAENDTFVELVPNNAINLGCESSDSLLLGKLSGSSCHLK